MAISVVVQVPPSELKSERAGARVWRSAEDARTYLVCPGAVSFQVESVLYQTQR
jgi:hypothetical protein